MDDILRNATTENGEFDLNNDGCADIPWDESFIAKGRIMTAINSCFAAVAIAIFLVRKLIIEKQGRDERSTTLIFNSSIRSVCNGTGIILQVTLLCFILYDLENHCYTSPELDIYYFSLILIVVEYVSEILLRKDMDYTLFCHHMMTLVMATLFVSENDPYTDTTSPVVDFSNDYPKAWKAIIGMGGSFGLLSTSSVFLDIPMCFYHTYKETKPVMVLSIMAVGVTLNFLAKLGCHTNMWVVYGKNLDLLPPVTKVLVPIAACFFMSIEYYLVYISFKITKSHRDKRTADDDSSWLEEYIVQSMSGPRLETSRHLSKRSIRSSLSSKGGNLGFLGRSITGIKDDNIVKMEDTNNETANEDTENV